MPRWIAQTAAVILVILCLPAAPVLAVQQQISNTVGVQAKIPTDPPSRAPTITTPADGQSFTTIPITVAGLCQTDLLVEIFDNQIFVGSVQCANGSYSLQIGLFADKNILFARQYDALDQASPDSNSVTVTFNSSSAGTSQPTITTEYSKRGANPGDTLLWPITISGGTAPYALIVDWGDKSAPDLKSIAAAGNLDLTHTYSTSGVFNIIIKLSDANGRVAFLQVVGAGNGPIKQTSTSQSQTVVKTNWALIIPLTLACIMLPVSFWLGTRHDRQNIKANIKQGKRAL